MGWNEKLICFLEYLFWHRSTEWTCALWIFEPSRHSCAWKYQTVRRPKPVIRTLESVIYTKIPRLNQNYMHFPKVQNSLNVLGFPCLWQPWYNLVNSGTRPRMKKDLRLKNFNSRRFQTWSSPSQLSDSLLLSLYPSEVYRASSSTLQHLFLAFLGSASILPAEQIFQELKRANFIVKDQSLISFSRNSYIEGKSSMIKSVVVWGGNGMDNRFQFIY